MGHGPSGVVGRGGELSRGGELHKGLYNSRGKYHCFLNSVVQSLWHLDAFRERFLALDYNHSCSSKPCVFCALRLIFYRYKFSDQTIIPPHALRETLSTIYRSEIRFQLEQMGDASECLDEILKWLHCDQVGLKSVTAFDAVACTPACISHVVFGAQVMDQKVCGACGASSNPLMSHTFVYTVYSRGLTERKAVSFYRALRAQWEGHLYSCPDSLPKGNGRACEAKRARIKRWCLGLPEVFALNVVWPERPHKDEITALMRKLPHEMCLTKIFAFPKHLEVRARQHLMKLSGFVCYYGMHYMAVFYSKTRREWLLFNDKTVTVLGNWANVVDRCDRGHWQPTIVFFQSRFSRCSSHALAKSMARPQKKRPLRPEPPAPTTSPAPPPRGSIGRAQRRPRVSVDAKILNGSVVAGEGSTVPGTPLLNSFAELKTERAVVPPAAPQGTETAERTNDKDTKERKRIDIRDEIVHEDTQIKIVSDGSPEKARTTFQIPASCIEWRCERCKKFWGQQYQRPNCPKCGPYAVV